MDFNQVYELIHEFNKMTHGSTNYDQDEIFVIGEDLKEFAPFVYLKKKLPIRHVDELLNIGFVFASYEIIDNHYFKDWYERQFSKKLVSKIARKISFLYRVNHKLVFDSLEKINSSYEILREQKILINSKNFPIQLGEWYAKSIFGLIQIKSSSQRGFDFLLESGRVEVKVHWKAWADERPSPKGVKIKKSLIQLSQSCIVIYLSRNFMIKEICFLDSEFILRKFASKGHTLFLKDNDISSYFFSKSSKHFEKVKNKTALMSFASPSLALKLDARLNADPKTTNINHL